jgi:hypothetical protein
MVANTTIKGGAVVISMTTRYKGYSNPTPSEVTTMGLGTALMTDLLVRNHIGYCNNCHEWTTFTKVVSNAFVCPVCGNFGSPGYNTKRG